MTLGVEAPTRPAAPSARASGHRAAPLLQRLSSARAAAGAHVVSLVVGLAGLAIVGRAQWFFGDEWEIIVNRGLRGSRLGILEPHNEHWISGPILVFRALFAVFGVRHYAPYLLVGLLVHVGVAHLLWRCMRRVGVDAWLATFVSAAFIVLGVGGENIWWAFQITFTGALALGLVHLLLVDHDGRWDWRDAVAVVVMVAALTFSAIALTLLFVSGLSVLLRRGWRLAMATVAPPGLVYGVWFLGFGHSGTAGDTITPGTLAKAPAYVWAGLTAAAEGATGLVGAGAVLALILVAWVAKSALPVPPDVSHFAGRRTLALALAIGAPAMYALVSFGRAAIGAPNAPRYAYIAVAMVVPAVAMGLQRLAGATTARTLAVLGLVAIVAVNGASNLRSTARADAEREQALRRQILAAGQLVASGAPLVSGAPEPTFDPDLDVATLDRLRRQHDLPPPTGVGPADRRAAAEVLQLAWLPAVPPALAGAGRFHLASTVRAALTPDGTGCSTLATTGPGAQLVLDSRGPSAASVRLSDGGVVGAAIRDDQGEGPARSGAVAPGGTLWLASSYTGTVLVALPAAGTAVVCGLEV